MTIRAYKESDFQAIESIYASCKLDEFEFEEREFELLPLQIDTRRLAVFRQSTVYVYDDNGVIGYGAISGLEISALFVHPSDRGKGVGKKLLSFLVSVAREPVSLYVVKSNRTARSMYEKAGFSVVGEFATEYNGIPVTACKMELTTSEA